MTYQQVWDTMSVREKAAAHILNWTDIDDNWLWIQNSVWNKILYRIAKIVLGGVDPAARFSFLALLLESPGETMAVMLFDLTRVRAVLRGS